MLIASITFFFIISRSDGEFLSLTHLVKLAETEVIMKKTLDTYAQDEQEKLEKLKKYFEQFDIRIKNDQLDIEAKIANPISAHALISRLLEFKNVLLPLTKSGRKLEEDLVAQIKSLEFPSSEDFKAVLGTVLRWQRTYNLSSEELARGEVLGRNYGKALTWQQCHHLGIHASEINYFLQAVDWLRVAKERLEPSEVGSEWESSVDLYLAYSLYRAAKHEEALQFIGEILKKGHTNAHFSKYITDLEKAIQGDSSRTVETSMNTVEEETMFEKFCRGKNYILGNHTTNLNCSYKFEKHPFLRIAPFKMEQISDDPAIYLFRDVLSDNEISTLRTILLEKFKKFSVQNLSQRSNKKHGDGTGNSAFLHESVHRTLPSISQRTADMTGLEVDPNEPLHVTNYGVGGFSNPHWDFFKKEYKDKCSLEDRSATVVFYLTDVEHGGATIFPLLDIAISPKKGSVLFWYNLHTNGDGDQRTLHGECPVLLGSKWIAIKYLTEFGTCRLTQPSQ